MSAESFRGPCFDVVYHCDVISHFVDPVHELRLAHDRLRDGGVLFLETGNLGGVRRRYFSLYPSFQLPDHLFFFSGKNLQDLLIQEGFEVLAMRRYPIGPQLAVCNALSIIRKLLGGKTGRRTPTRYSEDKGRDARSGRSATHRSASVDCPDFFGRTYATSYVIK